MKNTMPPKRKTGTKRVKRRALTKKQIEALHKQYIAAGGAQTGMGFMDWVKGAAKSVYNVGKKVYNTGKKVHNWVKDNRVASKIARAGSVLGIPGAAGVAEATEAAGYGRRRSQRGGAVMGSTVNARRLIRA